MSFDTLKHRFENGRFVTHDATGTFVGNRHEFVGGQPGDVLVWDSAQSDKVSWHHRWEIADYPALRPLMAALDAGYSTAFGVVGDSTGNATDEWVYLVAQWLAARYSAYTVKYHLWSDAAQAYSAPTVIQTGAAGERYVNFTGTRGRSLAEGDVREVTANLDARAKVLPSSWRPAAISVLMANGADAGFRSWWLQLLTGGALQYTWSADGTNLNTAQSTVAVTDTGTTPQWVRVTHDTGTQTVKFYTSTNGTSWTQLGADVATVAGALFDAQTIFEIGTRGTVSSPLTGRIYQVELRDGIDGPLIAPAQIDAWQALDASTTIEGAPELHIVNGSHTGAGLSYFADAPRLPKILPDYGQVAVFVSLSHNENRSLGATEMAAYGTLVSNLATYLPMASPVFLMQNPRISPATYIREHALRLQQLHGYARRNGYDVIDVFRVFTDAGAASYIGSDGIHPNTAGSALWAATVEDALLRS